MIFMVLRTTTHTHGSNSFTAGLLVPRAPATQPEFFSEELVSYFCKWLISQYYLILFTILPIRQTDLQGSVSRTSLQDLPVACEDNTF
jgi:hypothetical protein